MPSMKILAFDTSLGALSAAVRWRSADGVWLLREAHEVRERGHAERLMPVILKLMGEAGLPFCELDRIAVTIGPGSFTGVRVGVAAARALALATGAPTVAASSLAVMAHQSSEALGTQRRGRVLAMALDARRGSVYLQLFPCGHHAAGPPQLVSASAAALLIGRTPTILVGSGAMLVGQALAACDGEAETMLLDLLPSARALALMASELPPTRPLRPLYLKPPDVRPPADPSLLRACP
jgi:tRNA threonylcarbamoyladenosine biosynthesis protein TsaB